MRKLVIALTIIFGSYLAGLFEMEGFMPRAACLSFEMPTLVVRIVGDALTALAYASIPYSIRQFRRGPQSHVISKPTLLAFETFILLCGFGHFSDIVVVWYPWFRFDAAVRIVTGVVSVCVAAALLVEVPRLLDYVAGLARDLQDAQTRLYELQERTEGGSTS